eukprot:357001-Chlamydomonas_euryale.AAC.4
MAHTHTHKSAWHTLTPTTVHGATSVYVHSQHVPQHGTTLATVASRTWQAASHLLRITYLRAHTASVNCEQGAFGGKHPAGAAIEGWSQARRM